MQKKIGLLVVLSPLLPGRYFRFRGGNFTLDLPIGQYITSQ